MRIFFLLLITCLISASALSFAGAADFEGTISESIKSYVAEKAPSLKNAKIEVKIKNLKELNAALKNVKGRISFRLSPMSESKKFFGNLILPVEFFVDGSFFVRSDLNVNVSIFKEVIVTTRRIKRGEVIAFEDVDEQMKNVTYVPDNVVFEKNKVLSREAVSSLAKDTIMLSWMVRNIPAVKKGDIVRVVGSIKNIKVEADGICLQDGYVGDRIKVKNIDFKKVIDAKVISSNEVEARVK